MKCGELGWQENNSEILSHSKEETLEHLNNAILRKITEEQEHGENHPEATWIWLIGKILLLCREKSMC